MISSYERADIIHIMKMNRLTLIDSDTSHLEFKNPIKERDYRIIILVTEDSPQVSIKQDGAVIFNELIKSVDDLKIFFEEQLYKYLEV
jgi:hypothetical protein